MVLYNLIELIHKFNNKTIYNYNMKKIQNNTEDVKCFITNYELKFNNNKNKISETVLK